MNDGPLAYHGGEAKFGCHNFIASATKEIKPMTCRNLLTICMLGFALSLSNAATAQSGKATKRADTPSEPPAEATNEPERNILAGPQVEEEAETGRSNPMSAPNNVGKARASGSGGGLPFRQWMDVVRGVTLAPEQQEKIAVIAGEFQTAQRRFQRENGEQMRRLQEQVRLSRQNGTTPPESVREQYQKFEAAMPKQAEYQQRIWAELSAEQQSGVRTKLAEMEQRRAAEKAGKDGMPAASDMTMSSGGRATTTGGGNGSGARNDSKKDTNEGMGTTSGDVQGVRPAMEESPSSRDRDVAPEKPARPKLRGENSGSKPDAAPATGLDARGQKRLKFLQQHQSAGRAGNAPTPAEKTFKFNEDRDA